MQPDNNSTVSVETPVVETPVTEPQAPVTPEPTPQANQPAEIIDYKTKYEESERRRAGLDRKLSRLSRGTRTEGEEENLYTGDEELDRKVLEHPLTRSALDKLATYQLKEGVGEILKDFPNVPEQVVKAIQANPRGFVNVDAQTVDDAINDIEEYLINTFGESAQAKEQPKEFPVAQSNSVATEPSEKPIEQMSAEEISEKIDKGELKLSDVEDVVKKQSGGKEVKNTK
jgi:hypothetical protein